MGREIRMVKPGWEHPKDSSGRYIPLLGMNYTEEKDEFLKMVDCDGLQAALDYFGRAPNKNDYMPEWTEKEKTMLMMYEDTSEGTPISPAFETPEELARWLADNNASAFGRITATYEQWLVTCKQGWAPSAAFYNGEFKSGVAATADLTEAAENHGDKEDD